MKNKKINWCRKINMKKPKENLREMKRSFILLFAWEDRKIEEKKKRVNYIKEENQKQFEIMVKWLWTCIKRIAKN